MSGQVQAFVSSLAPDPRKALRRGLAGLADAQGDIRPLESELAGYSRLRVAGFRVIFREASDGEQRIVRCLFVERRTVVYELFREILRGELRAG